MSLKFSVYPDWLFAGPDPLNLMNVDPDPVRIQVNEITKLISNHIVEKKKIIFKSVPKLLKDSLFF